MLVLHDPGTLTHKTVELLGAKLIDALESPERITAILDALKDNPHHEIRTLSYSAASTSSSSSWPAHRDFVKLVKANHDPGYFNHLEQAHSTWVKEGHIKEDESILPECFPFPTGPDNTGKHPDPPKDLFARTGYYAFDMSSGITAKTYEAAMASAWLACQGVRTLMNGRMREGPEGQFTMVDRKTRDAAGIPIPPNTVLALCRPPGHHCDGNRAGGYCYLNNAVVAARAFQIHIELWGPLSGAIRMPRICILDLDFHHGNGTQSLVYADPNVLYISIHGLSEFPYYTGFESETGEGRAEGCNVNLPLPANASIDEYLEKLDGSGGAIERMKEYGPQAVVVSLGFDTFKLDPLGAFGVDTEDYKKIAAKVRDGMDVQTPVLILLEGGYVVERLGENMCSFLDGWEGRGAS